MAKKKIEKKETKQVVGGSIADSCMVTQRPCKPTKPK